MRLFVALDLPSDLADPLAALQDSLAEAGGVRPTDPEQAHVTLKFLGDTDPDRLPAVERAVEAAVDDADVGAFDVDVGGLGVFPSLDYISVVWTGIRAGSDQLLPIHERLEAETTDLGFDPESREFTPHVTLARMDDARGKDRVQRLVRERDPDIGGFRATAIELKESTLTDSGPEYETVRRFPL